jgi:serine/threonine protein kinase/Flp pilus assembly protein TadD
VRLTRSDSIEASPSKAGSLIRLSASLGGFVQDNPRVIAALEAYLEAARGGHPCSREEFLERHADIAAQLEQCLSGLDFVQLAGGQLGESAADSAESSGAAVAARATLGDYRIVREIGRGGMGVVYEAEQVSLGRRVALKVLPFAAAIDPKQRQRFQIEAQAAALLHHPHIVPIFGVGCENGVHFYAMQFVDGRSLAVILDEMRSRNDDSTGRTDATETLVPLQYEEMKGSWAADRSASDRMAAKRDSTTTDACRQALSISTRVAKPSSGSGIDGQAAQAVEIGPTLQGRALHRAVARMGAEAADALEHAHALGILHRDIKPANLLIDSAGAVWITDFGLARFPSDLSLTGTGDIVGTLRYMSPEQALARRGVVDQRTDIYALGATLYEFLTLRPPFDGRDHQELLRQIALDEPVPPRRVEPSIPRDLETILLKAMAKDPSCRYMTALELSADFHRFLEDRPIQARRPNLPERTFRWARRHRELVATAAAIVVLALAIGTAVSWTQARKTAAQALETEMARKALQAHIIETFPLLDRLAVNAMEQASKLVTGRAGAQARDNANRVYHETLHLYKRATEIPPADIESRKIVARAYKQLGFSRAVLSGANRTGQYADLALLRQAEADFQRSIDLYEKLLREAPRDRGVRRALAEALGTSGWGWLLSFTRRPAECEQQYSRSASLWRRLVTDIGGRNSTNISSEDTARQLNDVVYLADTVQTLAALYEARGEPNEAEALRQQLADDITELAERLAGPAFQEQRRNWAWRFVSMGQSSMHGENFRAPVLSFRLAMILDPENAQAHNNLAWMLVCTPLHPLFDPKQGLALAQRAVALEPNDWRLLNTLGVAAFRTGDWETAADTLQKSTIFTGGSAHDWFFLAMTRWRQGNTAEAQEWFERAVTLARKNSSPEYMQREVRLFHAEAAELLGLPGPNDLPKEASVRENKKIRRTSLREIVGPGARGQATPADAQHSKAGDCQQMPSARGRCSMAS